MSNSVLSCKYFCIISGLGHVLLLQQGRRQMFQTGGAKLKINRSVILATPTFVQVVSRASSVIYFTCAEITKKRIISACANIGLAREIIVHVRSSACFGQY